MWLDRLAVGGRRGVTDASACDKVVNFDASTLVSREEIGGRQTRQRLTSKPAPGQLLTARSLPASPLNTDSPAPS